MSIEWEGYVNGLTWATNRVGKIRGNDAHTVNALRALIDAEICRAKPLAAAPNPDSTLRQALVAAEKALAPFARFTATVETFVEDRAKDGGSPIMPAIKDFRLADFLRAREAHALITEALQRGE